MTTALATAEARRRQWWRTVWAMVWPRAKRFAAEATFLVFFQVAFAAAVGAVYFSPPSFSLTTIGSAGAAVLLLAAAAESLPPKAYAGPLPVEPRQAAAAIAARAVLSAGFASLTLLSFVGAMELATGGTPSRDLAAALAFPALLTMPYVGAALFPPHPTPTLGTEARVGAWGPLWNAGAVVAWIALGQGRTLTSWLWVTLALALLSVASTALVRRLPGRSQPAPDEGGTREPGRLRRLFFPAVPPALAPPGRVRWRPVGFYLRRIVVPHQPVAVLLVLIYLGVSFGSGLSLGSRPLELRPTPAAVALATVSLVVARLGEFVATARLPTLRGHEVRDTAFAGLRTLPCSRRRLVALLGEANLVRTLFGFVAELFAVSAVLALPTISVVHMLLLLQVIPFLPDFMGSWLNALWGCSLRADLLPKPGDETVDLPGSLLQLGMLSTHSIAFLAVCAGGTYRCWGSSCSHSDRAFSTGTSSDRDSPPICCCHRPPPPSARGEVPLDPPPHPQRPCQLAPGPGRLAATPQAHDGSAARARLARAAGVPATSSPDGGARRGGGPAGRAVGPSADGRGPRHSRLVRAGALHRPRVGRAGRAPRSTPRRLPLAPDGTRASRRTAARQRAAALRDPVCPAHVPRALRLVEHPASRSGRDDPLDGLPVPRLRPEVARHADRVALHHVAAGRAADQLKRLGRLRHAATHLCPGSAHVGADSGLGSRDSANSAPGEHCRSRVEHHLGQLATRAHDRRGLTATCHSVLGHRPLRAAATH